MSIGARQKGPAAAVVRAGGEVDRGDPKAMRGLEMRAVLVLAFGAACLSGCAAPAGAQAFDWRLGVGAGFGEIRSTGPEQAVPGTPTTLVVALDRRVAPRVALGVEWLGTWYDDDRWGRQQRQALMLMGTIYPVGEVAVSAGAGPGLASWVAVSGPPPGGVGDAEISVYDGESALALAGGVGVDVSAGAFQVTPLARLVVHRLRGEAVTTGVVAIRLSLRSGR
jgi:hypothetical protein